VLFVSPFPPRLDGVHGGSRAVAQLLMELADRHEAACVYLRGEGEPTLDPKLRERLDVAIEVNRPGKGSNVSRRLLQRFRLLWGLLLGRPVWVTRWAVPRFADTLARLVTSWQPEIVELEYHLMGQYLHALRGSTAARVLVQYDPGASAAREAARTTSGPRRLLALWDARAWERFERGIMRRVDAVVVLTERDRATLASLAGQTRLVQIPLGVRVPDEPLSPIGTTPPRLLFVGNFIHPPNRDAASWLLYHIFPRVRGSRPDCQLDLVGDQPPAETRAAAAAAGVVVTGRVPDVTEYLDRAAVVLAPLRLGGGMRVKVLEAVAAGKAVVATPRAVEGLSLDHGRHVLLADTDSEFCERILDLLMDEELRRTIARGARSWAEQNLGGDRSFAAFDRLYHEILSERSGERGAKRW
jgi:polysaccharide biosynthesis protein PslH